MCYIFVMLFGICVIHDLHNKRIPAVWIWLCILVMAMYRGYLIILEKSSLVECVFSVIPGILLLLISYVGKQMGNGDGLLIVACGLYFGWEKLLEVLTYAFLLAGVFSIGYLLIERNLKNNRIPFVPFLFGAAVISFMGVGS